MKDFADIPNIPDREKRLDEITVDCYDPWEQLAGFEVYLTEALRFPFAAIWRGSDEEDEPERQGEPVTVLSVADVDDQQGILLQVRQTSDQQELSVPAEEIWAADGTGPNATVLDDYRFWFSQDPLEEDDWY
jgi:hypothetical protein